MRKSFAAIVFGFAALALIALPASAAGPYGLSFSGAGIPFVSGDVADAEGSPAYKDAFDTGWGGRVELYYDFTPSLRGQFGGTYQVFSGQDVDLLGLPVQFEDLEVWAIYLGGKYRFLPGSKFRPYLVGDVGYAQRQAVDIALSQDLVVGGQVFPAGSTVAFWDDTGTYFADLGLGFEFMVTPNLGIYLDARAQIFGTPDEALIATPSVEGDPPISVPISLGLNFNF
jgi:outer membrane protein W